MLQPFRRSSIRFLFVLFFHEVLNRAGGTGPLWIPVPTKLFHNGGSTTWSVVCTCNSILKLLAKLLSFGVFCISVTFPSYSRRVPEQLSIRFRPGFDQFWRKFGQFSISFRSVFDLLPINFRSVFDRCSNKVGQFSMSFHTIFDQFPINFRSNFDQFPTTISTLTNYIWPT